MELFTFLLTFLCATNLSLSAQNYQITNYNVGITTDILVDEIGNIYCGHVFDNQGLTVIHPDGDTNIWNVVSSGAFSTFLSRIAFDENGDIFALSYGSGYVYRFDLQGQSTAIGQVTNSFPANYSTALVYQSDTSVLVCARMGLHRMNTVTGVSSFITTKYDLLGTIIDPNDGTIWCIKSGGGATLDTSTLFHLSATGEFIAGFDNINCNNGGIYTNQTKTYPLAFGPNSSIWYATGHTGIWYLDGQGNIQNENTTTGMPSNIVHDIAFDADFQNAWIATGAGLTRLELETHTYTTYAVPQGMIDSVVLSVYLDNNGNIYAGTMKGVSKLAIVSSLPTNSETKTNVYPNPAYTNADIVLQSPTTAEASLQITTVSGQLIAQYELPIGCQKYSFDIQNLPNATYIIQVRYEDGHTTTTQLLKL